VAAVTHAHLAAAGVAVRRLLPAVVSGVIGSACGIGLLALSGWLITRASQRPPIFALSIAIGAVQAAALGRGVARYAQRLGVHAVALDVLGSVRLRLFDALEPLVPAGLGPVAPGAVISGFMSDAELVANGLATGLTAAVDVVASVVMGAVVAAAIDPPLGAILVAAAAAAALGAWGMARLGRSGAEADAAGRAQLADTVVEILRAAPELVAYGRADLLEARLQAVDRQAAAAARRQALGAGAGRAVAMGLGGAGLVAVVGAGLAARHAGDVSGVALAVVVFTAIAVFDQVANLAPVLTAVGSARLAERRLRAVGELPPPAPEPRVPLRPAPGATTARLDRVDVELGEHPALRAVSFDLGAGRRLALTGPSGSGKTTVLHALLHFLTPSAGTVSLGGVDVSAMSRADIASLVGWMADDTYLFAATVADNLRIAQPTASDAELLDVLGRVGLSAWLASLPAGLDTVIGAGGRPVSAGERQRLGMARALLAGGGVLLLDEPTAHLDPVSAPSMLDLLMTAARGRSVLLVSHDTDTIGRLVDEVVELAHGLVVGRQPDGGRRMPSLRGTTGEDGVAVDHATAVPTVESATVDPATVDPATVDPAAGTSSLDL